jgi:glycosyltransferase involved in cell wall biosynthesis
MRIGLSTSVIQRGRTGIAQYVLALTRSLLAHASEHQFSLFVLEEDLPLFAFAAPQMQLIPVAERYRAPVKNILWHQFRLPRLAREHRLDALHVPSYRRLLWPRPCALVATIHDLAPFHVRGKYDWMRMLYGRVVARYLAARQHQIIAISHNTARDLKHHFGISEDRLTIIHNGLDHDRFCPGPVHEAGRTVAARHGVQQPFFLYVARLEHPGKNHLRLIEAFNQFKAETHLPWQLLLPGSDWDGADAIHAAIGRSPFEADIFTPGFVPDEHLPVLYRAADVFVLPSLHEGFGLPALEAMACGCPVLCSTKGALGEVVGDAALTMDPENTAELKNQMVRLAADGGLRKALQVAGLKQAQRFQWRDNAAATLRVYARAIARARNE